MKHTFVFLALAAAVPGLASAATNYSDASSWIDLLDLQFVPFVGGPVIPADYAYSHNVTSAMAQATGGAAQTSTGTDSASEDVVSAYASAGIDGTTHDLTAFASATNGNATGSASEVFSFSLSGTGDTVLEIPYTLNSQANSQNIITWVGSSSSNINGAWTNGLDHGETSDFVTASTSGAQASSTSDTLDFVLKNHGNTPTQYQLTLTTTAQADFSGGSGPAPVPEPPVAMLLSLGLIIPLLARRVRQHHLI
jgi:hypothetical protein